MKENLFSMTLNFACHIVSISNKQIHKQSFLAYSLLLQRLIQLLRPRQHKPSARDDIYARSVRVNRLDRIQLGVRDRDIRMTAKICLLRILLALS